MIKGILIKKIFNEGFFDSKAIISINDDSGERILKVGDLDNFLENLEKHQIDSVLLLF